MYRNAATPTRVGRLVIALIQGAARILAVILSVLTVLIAPGWNQPAPPPTGTELPPRKYRP
jgi:hypothetical protein